MLVEIFFILLEKKILTIYWQRITLVLNDKRKINGDANNKKTLEDVNRKNLVYIW